jgi:hypothetical protein
MNRARLDVGGAHFRQRIAEYEKGSASAEVGEHCRTTARCFLSLADTEERPGPRLGRALLDFDSPFYTGCMLVSPHDRGSMACSLSAVAVRPEGANHQWRRIPLGEFD